MRESHRSYMLQSLGVSSLRPLQKQPALTWSASLWLLHYDVDCIYPLTFLISSILRTTGVTGRLGGGAADSTAEGISQGKGYM